jgi:hypothetical protein
MQVIFGRSMMRLGNILNRSRDKNFLTIEQARKINYNWIGLILLR